MKKVLILLSVVVGMTSCSKSDDDFAVPTPKQVQTFITLPSKSLTLDMFDVHVANVPSTKTIPFIEGGYRYEWTLNSEQYTLLFQVDVDTNDIVQHITGRYNGHSFVMYQGVINVCGGTQGGQISYSIR